MIDLQHLKIFLRICELGSFTEAAMVLGVAQPTVSRVVKEMESHWGGQLFYRTGRGVTLSEFGEVAHARVRVLVNQYDQVTSELGAYSKVPSGKVAVGLSPSLAPALVPGLVNALRREAPGISLSIHEGFSDQIERWRVAGVVDIGVSSNFRDSTSEAMKTPVLFKSNLVLVASGATEALPEEIDFTELERFPLVLPSAPNGLRAIFEDVARRKGIELNIALETDSIIVQKQVCQHCGGFLIKAPETISEELGQGIYRTCRIRDPQIQRYLELKTTSHRPLSLAAREVASRLTTMLKRESV